MSDLKSRMEKAVNDYNAGLLSDDDYKKILEGITFYDYTSVFSCCHNCEHWLVDHSLMGKYEYNTCTKRNLWIKCAAVCNQYSGRNTIVSPIHNIDDQKCLCKKGDEK